MSPISKVFVFFLANCSIGYVSAAGCGLSIGKRPDSPGKAEEKSKRKEKLPVDVGNLPPGCDKGDTIEVQLPNGKFKTFKRSHGILSNKPFHGESEDGSSFQYIRTEDSMIFGSLVDLTDQSVSQFSIDSLGNQVVDTIPTIDFPPEADPMNDERKLVESDEPISMSSSSFIRARSPSSTQSSSSRDLLDDLGGNLDVLVVWTANAECRNSGLATGCSRTATTESNMRSRINLAVTETNTAYNLSGVDTQLNLVHAAYVGSYTEVSGDAFSQALNHITSTSDGVIDNVHALRTQYGADLVAMIIDDPQYCGMAWLGPSKSNMFSVTAWNCATGYYSFGHEIGHNLGCNHDKGTSGQCSNSNYNYGWRDPNANFRSILAYNCVSGQCDNNAGGGCSRVQRFSNPNFLYNGSPIGNAEHDNARRINDVKAVVAGYYPHITDPGTLSPTTSPTAAPTVLCVAGEKLVKIDIITDNYPQETSWTLTNTCTNTIVRTGGPYATEGALESEEFCVPEGNYVFELSDSYGDGICCSYGQGSYSVSYGSNQVAAGGAFSSSEVTTFGDQCISSPTQSPSASPSASPTKAPSASPTVTKSASPTKVPSASPTASPTKAPSALPSASPTKSPSALPTASPTKAPSASPTVTKSASPTKLPSASPTASPTKAPSALPTASPTKTRTASPTMTKTASPTKSPTASPTASPTKSPTASPTASPTKAPSASPTASPTKSPTASPTVTKTASPTKAPSKATLSPTQSPIQVDTCSTVTKKRQCQLTRGCQWAGGSCSTEISRVTPSPTKAPTKNSPPPTQSPIQSNQCSIITRKRQCERTNGCTWVGGLCV